MKELNKIVSERLKIINSELDKVGAKKVTRDTVKKHLDEMQSEIQAELQANADKLVNKLVISGIQQRLDEFKAMFEER